MRGKTDSDAMVNPLSSGESGVKSVFFLSRELEILKEVSGAVGTSEVEM